MSLFFINLIVLLASIIGTISGFGIATILVSLLISFFPLAQTLLFSGIIHLVNDIWKLIFFGAGIRWRLLIIFGGFGLVASYVGASLSVVVEQSIACVLFGFFCVCYSLLLLIRPSFVLSDSTLMASIGGLVSGFLAGIFGMGGVTRALFLAAFNLDKLVFLATSGAIALVVDSTRLITYYAHGVQLEKQLLLGIAYGIPISFIGAKIGEMIITVVSQKQFRAIVAVCLLLLGLKLLLFNEFFIVIGDNKFGC